MAIFDSLFGRRTVKAESPAPVPERDMKVVVGANNEINKLEAFDNSNITYSTTLSDTDYLAWLRNKQANITNFYRLSDFYTDADPIVHGIIKHVYEPLTITDWYLTCPNQKSIDIFEEYYKQIKLREILADVALQLHKYANVFVYVWDGVPTTLPPHKCVIANITMDGTPVVDFNVQDLQNEFQIRSYSYDDKNHIKDDELKDVLDGYPPEIAQAIKAGKQYARLNPENTFVIQGAKEAWQRYAIPWITAALPALARKELIQNYEESMLNIGSRAFVHVRYGDEKKEMYPDRVQLTEVQNIFRSAMRGSPLAVTNHLAHAEVVQADLNDLYQFPLYSQVNSEILAAGGIAGIIVNGDSQEGSTFASAQVSTQIAVSRVESARHELEQFMNKLNYRLVEEIRLIRTNNLKQIPEFHFMPTGINGQKEMKDSAKELWLQGLMSNATMMQAYGYSLTKEKALREQEASDGTDEVMIPRTVQTVGNAAQTEDDGETKNGRPTKSDDERNSDPENAIRSKQAKDAEDGDLGDGNQT